MNITQPGPCPICKTDDWAEHYRGPIRVGRFGNLSAEPATIWRCSGCGAALLPDSTVDYQSDEYRKLVDGDAGAGAFHRMHDPEQAERLHLCGTADLRGKVIADVGCGAGSFLDLVSGMASTTLAIEPTRSFHGALRNGGHQVYSFAADALPEWRGRVDRAYCFSVIEHVNDPLELLRDIRGLLGPDGRAWVSTPNRHDWLLELLGADYATFFYRQVHRWYFDRASLEALALRAGFSSVRTRFVHRFDMANFLLWIRDRRPSGQGGLEVPSALESSFRQALVDSGRADYLHAEFLV